MPIYEYRCANGHSFEVFRSMTDDPLTECEECGAAVERVFHPVAVHYKGSGFYTTDYAKKGAKATAGGDDSSSSSKPDSDSDSDPNPTPPKSDSSSSKSDSGSSSSATSSD